MKFVERHERLFRSFLFWIAYYLVLMAISGTILYLRMPEDVLGSTALIFGGFIGAFIGMSMFPTGLAGFIALVFGIIPFSSENLAQTAVGNMIAEIFISLPFVVLYWLAVLLAVIIAHYGRRKLLSRLALFLLTLGLLTFIGCQNIPPY